MRVSLALSSRLASLSRKGDDTREMEKSESLCATNLIDRLREREREREINHLVDSIHLIFSLHSFSAFCDQRFLRYYSDAIQKCSKYST